MKRVERPPLLYLVLFILTLGLWSLQSSERMIIAGVAALLSALAYVVPLQLRLSPGWLISLATFSFLFCYYVIYGNLSDSFVSIYNLRQMTPLATTLVGLAVAQWYLPRSRRFDWLLFTLGLLFLFSSISWEVSKYKLIYTWLVEGFVSLLLLYQLVRSWQGNLIKRLQGFPQWRYSLQIGACFALFLVISVAGIKVAEYVDQRYANLMAEMLVREKALNTSGFGGQTTLEGGKEIELSDRIALLVSSSQPLNYLRGNVLTNYRQGQWLPSQGEVPMRFYLGPTPESLNSKGYRLIQRDPKMPPAPTWGARITPQISLGGTLFAPAEATVQGVDYFPTTRQDSYSIVHQQNAELKTYLLAGSDTDEIPIQHMQRTHLIDNLALQPGLRAALRPLAEEITAEASTQREKAAKIEAWFHDHFKYSLSAPPIPPGQDPTLVFIQERRPGWCSWFASGMVLMLRSLNIPAHVVSGWRSMDLNPLTGLYVIREKEAHDWVEMLDLETRSWVRFDPTPPQQLAAVTGATRPASIWTQSIESLHLLFQSLQKTLNETSFEQKLELFQATALGLLRTPTFYGALLLVMVLNQLLKRVRPKAQIATPAPEAVASLPPEIVDQHLSHCSELFLAGCQARGIPVQPDHTLAELYTALVNQAVSAEDLRHAQYLVEQLQRARFEGAHLDYVALTQQAEHFAQVTHAP
jgi:transglutaminase-like putative cysteine protease